MARTLYIKDDRQRVAEVTAWTPRPKQGSGWQGPAQQSVASARLIKTTSGRGFQDLMTRHATVEALTKALIQGDPEIDREQVGRHTGQASRVYLRQDGKPLHSAQTIEVVESPQGEEIERREAQDEAATVGASAPIVCTDKLFPIEAVVGRFAFSRKLQLRHVDTHTFDILYDLAESLHNARKLCLVGTGDQGEGPLVLQRNGTPYRGFLEGRVQGRAYLLVLHLSNLELKAVTSP